MESNIENKLCRWERIRSSKCRWTILFGGRRPFVARYHGPKMKAALDIPWVPKFRPFVFVVCCSPPSSWRTWPGCQMGRQIMFFSSAPPPPPSLILANPPFGTWGQTWASDWLGGWVNLSVRYRDRERRLWATHPPTHPPTLSSRWSLRGRLL